MAEEQLDIKLQESLLRQSHNLQVSMDKYNSILEKVVGKFEDINDYEGDINVELEKTGKTLKEKIFGKLKDIAAELKDHILRPLTIIFSATYVVDHTKALLENVKTIKNLSFRMGEAGKTAGQLSASMYTVANRLGLSSDQALELIAGLSRLRVPTKDLTEMATATGRFARITGVSNDEAIQLTANLMRMGRLGAEATKEVLTGMTNLQRTVGLSEADMGHLSEGIIYSTRMLGQMGKNASTIQNFNKGVINLAAGFTKVGLKIEDVNKLIEDLLDPGRIEDNALLYAKLGVSIQDVVAGNVDMTQLNSKMREFGQQMKTMSGPAAAALAKQMGMTLMQARALADLPIDQGITKAGKISADMYEEQRSIQEKMLGIWNTIGNRLEQVMQKYLLPFIEKALPWLQKNWKVVLIGGVLAILLLLPRLRQRFLGVATDFGKTLETATTEALVMGSKKAATISEQQAGMKGRARGSAVTARVQAGPEYGSMQGQAKLFQTLSQSNLFPIIARMTENTSEWLNKISMGSKPLSLLGILTEQYNQKIKDRIGFARMENTMLVEAYNQRKFTLKAESDAIQNRLTQIEGLSKKEQEHTTIIYEKRKLLDDQSKLTDQIIGLSNDITRENERLLKISEAQVLRLDPEHQKNLYEQLKATQERLNAEMTGQRILVEDLTNQKRANQAIESSLKAKIEEVNSMARGRDLSEAEARILSESYKEVDRIKRENITISTELETQNRLFSEQHKSLLGVKQDINNMAKALKTTDLGAMMAGIQVPTRKSIFTRAADYMKSAFHNIGSGLINTADKMKNSLITVGKDLAQRLNPANWIKSAVAGAREGGGTVTGKILGTFGKLAGITLGILTTLGLMEPIQKAIGMILKAVKPIVTQLVAKLMPIIVALIKAFLPLLELLIQTLLPPLLIILGYLVEGIGYLLKAIAALVKIFSKTGGDVVGKFADAVVKAGQDIRIAAGKMNLALDENTDATDSNTDAVEPKAGVLGVTGGGATLVRTKPIYTNAKPEQTTAEAGLETAEKMKQVVDQNENQTSLLREIRDLLRTGALNRTIPVKSQSNVESIRAGTGAH